MHAVPPMDWDESHVESWLTSLGLQQHAARFHKSHISGAILLTFTPADLLPIGVEDEGEQKRIVEEVQRLHAQHRAQAAAAASSAASATAKPSYASSPAAAVVIVAQPQFAVQDGPAVVV